MKIGIWSLKAFLNSLLFAGLFIGISQAIADECQLDSISGNSPLTIPFHTSSESFGPTRLEGVAYATGDCRENCKDWGNTINPQNGEKLYKSYNYIEWDNGLRICKVSSLNIPCPLIGAGSSECNY